MGVGFINTTQNNISSSKILFHVSNDLRVQIFEGTDIEWTQLIEGGIQIFLQKWNRGGVVHIRELSIERGVFSFWNLSLGLFIKVFLIKKAFSVAF